ncbi:hypothetical protein D3C76_1359410 [compost metagenome]
MNKHPGWHVGVSNQVMCLTDQFVVSETADVGEGVVAVSDAAVQVGRGDQSLVGGEGSFMLGNGQIHSHRVRFLFGLLV